MMAAICPRLKGQIMRYADNSVGSIMEFEVITVRPEATLAAVQRCV